MRRPRSTSARRSSFASAQASRAPRSRADCRPSKISFRMVGQRLAEARRYAGAFVVDGFFNGFSRLARLHPRAAPHRHSVERLLDVRYADGDLREHLLDVWRPAEANGSPPPFRHHSGPPWPIVFYVHGGGFRILSKDTHWIMGLGFSRHGFIVFNVSYRLAPRWRFPCALEDLAQAFTWVVENA